MTQGIFIGFERPKSKKAIKEAVAANPHSVRLEATSMVGGNEYDGPVDEMPEGRQVTFVGPDPYTKRTFYGNIRRVGNKIMVS